ncbi:asparagine synthase (glutamine-hydrolyzing) [Desulfotomaculum copahuensis]|uniref:asparagine synthase (glutamine-hydrolyzing) n=1 Tax=Desulfotomaculum copahuensis TaxID=1838280 RepID=A0A1B7LCJ7_9FIRM|nr:asparagine synthase (glutamine-hydrolyzing) [Desulfotomaculum copahuensis]OAT80395.1 asparagine synthase (glutamine-hydrolyzing) [Desulfotomaculum copahuensis]
MCGITGWIDWERDLSGQGALIEAMTGKLRHRGPDAQGCWLSAKAALGHRRLIVIDPEGGAQPMVSKEGGRTCALTYNGEIYNYRELRKELADRGHRFRSQSDTEVLLRSYLEWGEDCVRRLNGIFALGIWDEQKQQLFLARDHLGVKPLFYARRGSAVLFGSEIKALLAHPLVEPELDADGLAEVFNFFPLHTPGSAVFKDIKEVRPGHCHIFARGGERVIQYWSLHSAPHNDDLATTTEHIRALLEDTVGRQLIADVPVVTLLSGGLDSSGLTAMAAGDFQQAGKQLHTYSVDFKESSRYFMASAIHKSLDAPWINRVADYLGTKHHTITLDTPELLDNLLIPMYAHDHPAYGQIETSMFLLFKAMKQEATVALSGESADEIFGGYQWFAGEDLLDAATFPWIVEFGKTEVAHEAFSLLSPELLEIIQPRQYLAAKYREAVAEVPRLKGEDAVEAKRREGFYLNLTRFLPILLDRKDRMSMAVGFEVRVPFCDYRLVEYVWNVPWELKVAGNIEKGILRRSFAGLLPDDVLYRHKSGYPTSQHPSYIKGVRDALLPILDDPQAPVRPFLNIPFIKSLLTDEAPSLTHVFNVNPLERIIQINSWLNDYHVHIGNAGRLTH